jgi:hypothetical protein
MDRHACPRTVCCAVVAAGLFAWALPAISAEADYCVTCKNPDVTYRCRVTGVGKRPSDALKLYCVIRTAKEGNHGSCAAESATSACNGLVKVYTYDGPTLPEGLTADPRIRELKQRVEQDQRAFEKPKGDAPKTLFQLGGRAVNASAKGLRNARSALGGSSSDDAAPAPAPAAAPPPAAAAPSTASLPPETQATTGSVPEATESVGTATRVKQAAQGASSAVGGFARKSYRCVRSLFRNCSGEPEDGQALE